MFFKSILGLTLIQKMRVNKNLEYEVAPSCKYPKGGCICKRYQSNESQPRCFYKKGPNECCFEKEEPEEILEKSK